MPCSLEKTFSCSNASELDGCRERMKAEVWSCWPGMRDGQNESESEKWEEFKEEPKRNEKLAWPQKNAESAKITEEGS